MATSVLGPSAPARLNVLRDHAIYLGVVALYTLPNILSRDLFYRDETRYGGIVREMIATDSWLTTTIGGAPYLEKPPLFFSLIRLVAETFHSTDPWVFFAVVAVSAFFYLAASDAFLRTAGFDRRTVRLANLFLLAVPWIAIHMQVLRMDLLFSALILSSAACYAHGTARAEANPWPVLGGLLAGLAVLVKGPFGALMPILGIAAYLVVARRARLLIRADFLWSLVVAILLPLAWLGLVYASFGGETVARMFAEEIVERVNAGRDAQRPWWLYGIWLTATIMPWLLLTPLLLARRLRAAIFAPDPSAPPGLRLVIPYTVVCFILLSLTAQKNVHYLLPLVPGLMVLLALAYRRLEPVIPRLFDWFYLALAVVALIGPPALVWSLGFLSASDRAEISLYLPGALLPQLGATLSLTAIPIAIGAALRADMRLVASIASVAVLIYGLHATVLAELDRVYNPRPILTMFERQVPSTEPITVYRVYDGALSYHSDRPLVYVGRDDGISGRALTRYVITTEGNWRNEPGLFAGFEKLAEARLETITLILLRRADSPGSDL